MSAGDNSKKSSFVFLYIAIGFAVGGVLMVPLFSWLPITHAPTFETNGQIGDFVGGILNPIIALMALMWLKKGVELQQHELSETKATLQASEQHQAKQVKIAAISALLTSVQEEISRFREYREAAEKRSAESKRKLHNAEHVSGPLGMYEELQEAREIHEVNEKNLRSIVANHEKLASERGGYLSELKELLNG